MFLRHANAWSVKTQKHLCKFKFNINASINSLAKLLLRMSITSTSTTLGVATSWADLPCSTIGMASCHTPNIKHGFKWGIFMAVFMFMESSGSFSFIFPANTFGEFPEWKVSCSSVKSWEQWENWPVCVKSWSSSLDWWGRSQASSPKPLLSTLKWFWLLTMKL